MSQNSHPTTTDPVLAHRSSHNWNAFTRVTTYSALAIIAVLALMAIFLT